MLSRCALLLWFAFVLSAQDRAVTVREERVALPTYNEGAPDPNPQFAALHHDVFPNYPYTIRTPANKIRRVTEWRVLVIENEYLSCRVLPDLGGHLQGCTDRITGTEIFYSNPAVRNNGDSGRAAFIATGIESSFPIAHSRVAASPVDFAWSVRDGVGTVVVENTDRVSGMQWRCEFILRPGSALLEQRVTLYNGTAARRGYHWWANAAVELNDPHLRFVYPAKWMLPHGEGAMTSWPISSTGADLSDAANHKTGVGLFAHGSREPWIAVYKPKFRTGLAHYADPEQVPGKKLWLWGTDGDHYVTQTLTEKFNSYVEMQVGVFETQPEFAFLLPGETKVFSHFWIPFRDLGGISRATRDAVLNLSRNGRTATVELDATHAIPGATIRVADGAKTIFETRADLNPAAKFAKTLDNAPEKLIVELTDAAGKLLLHHLEGEYDSTPFDKNARNPEPVAPKDSSDSETAILARGTWNEQRDQWSLAWNDYQAGLKKAPASTNLALAAGRAALVLNRYDDAVRLLENLTGGNNEAAYYFGAALRSSSLRLAEAKVSLARAAEDSRFSAAARLQLALLNANEDGGHAVQALAASPGAHAGIGALEVAVLRRAGQIEEAKRRLAYWLQQDPANNMLRVERWLLEKTEDASLWNHLGTDPERLLDVADAYRELGACDDALKILDRRYSAVPANEMEPGTEPPQENPLVLYFRGYCRMKTGGDPTADFNAASQRSTLYIFPHREIYFNIFAAALKQNDRDAVAHALLGELSFDSLRTEQAIAEWNKALSLQPDLPALHRNLGRALLEIKGDRAAAAQVLLAGMRLHPGDQEIAKAWANAWKESNVPAPGNPVGKDEVATRALVLSATDPDAAAALFSTANFPEPKQTDTVRRAYIEVQLQLLLARAYGGRCGEALAGLQTLGDEVKLPFTFYGFGPFMKVAHLQYYQGVVENICGDQKSAIKRWSKLSHSSEPAGSPERVFPLLAAKRLNERDALAKIQVELSALAKASPDTRSPASVFAQGALSLAAGKTSEGTALLRSSSQATDPFLSYLSQVMLSDIALSESAR